MKPNWECPLCRHAFMHKNSAVRHIKQKHKKQAEPRRFGVKLVSDLKQFRTRNADDNRKVNYCWSCGAKQ